MERNLLVGNGINIQFGGVNAYSSSAIMSRVVENIKAGKYTALTENSLSVDEQLGILDGMTKMINQIKAGGCRNKADGLLMHIELDRISRTYPDESTVTSVFLEDYFLAFEIFNNGYWNTDGEKTSKFYRKIVFDFLRRIIVDGIYNNGDINEVYQNFYPGVMRYLQRFDNIFTTNYDYNLESSLGSGEKICHLHGEFGKLAPEYRTNSKYYAEYREKCDDLIAKKISGMDHVYSDAVMSWSWLDKYGELLEADTRDKKDLFQSISGQLEIVGLSPANDGHLFMMINNNPNIRSVVYYYLKDDDKIELPHHIKKPTTFKKVTKLWESMK